MISRALLHMAASLLIGIGCLMPAAWAQPEVGTIASVVGAVEVQRGGTGDWQAGLVGTAVFLSDAIRTDDGAIAKLVFVDGSVVDLAEHTNITIERFTADPLAAERRALLRLTAGRARALVGEQYGQPQARYEIETPTAVVRVQSTAFIVAYDSAEEATEVVGIAGVVAVQGALGVIGPAVEVAAQEFSRVQKGAFPTPAKPLEAADFARYQEGLETIGTGGREGLEVGHRLVAADLLRADDRPERIGAAGAGWAKGQRSYLHPTTPGETLMDRLSPDVRANTQPLPVYQADSPRP